LPRYFEIIITGRQLAALVVGVALAIAAAFGLGVGVRMLQPGPHEVAAVAPAVPTPVWQPTPPAIPTAVPTPEVVATPISAATQAPVPTERPKALPTVVAARRAEPRWVQVVALGKREQAEGVRTRVVALGYTPRQVLVQPAAGGKFRVRVGPFPDVESAGRVAARLRAEGFGGTFVVNE
jgi:cell division protein FtsN